MWFEDRPSAIQSAGYAVATSDAPEGPFVTRHYPVAVADVPGDFSILVDDDGSAYHVQTTTNDPKATKGFAVTRLNDAYTGPTNMSAAFEAPLPAEGPVFFKRGGTYYVLGGTTCCACRGGASIYVFTSPHPLGPWRYRGDVDSVKPGTPPDPHSPHNYVTRAQGSAVFTVGGGGNGGGSSADAQQTFVWLGNQWVTGGRRNADLLYWSALSFADDGMVAQVHWQDTVTVDV